MPPKRKRVPNDDLVFRILLLSALNVDCKIIARKVKYKVDTVRKIIASQPELPIKQVLQTYNGDCESIAKKANCSRKQVRKIILAMQPTVDLDVLNTEIASETRIYEHVSPQQSTNASATRNNSENDFEKVLKGKKIYQKIHVL